MAKKGDENLIGSDSALLEARYFIELALEFANEDEISPETLDNLTVLARLGFKVELGDLPEESLALMKKEHRRLRQILQRIVEDPNMTPDLERTLNFWLKNERLVQLQFEDRKLAIHHTIDVSRTGIIEGAKLGVALLFATDRARFLRACKEGCGDVFLAEGQRSRAKYCSKCVAEIKKDQNKSYVKTHRKRKRWLEENDPEAFADVLAAKTTLAAAYEASKAKQRRK